MAQADRASRVDGQLNGRPLPPTDWQVRVAGVDHDVVIHGDDVTVDGEALIMALDYTPGDRIMEAEFGDQGEGSARRSDYTHTDRLEADHPRRIPCRARPPCAHRGPRGAYDRARTPDLSRFLLSPMPGRLVARSMSARATRLSPVSRSPSSRLQRWKYPARRSGRTVAKLAAAAGETSPSTS